MKASKPQIPFFSFGDQRALTTALAARIKTELENDLNSIDQASLAVPGGNTPRALFDALSVQELRWDNVLITLTDERWIDPDHEHSNEKMVRDHLLQHKAKTATLLALKNSAATPFEGEKDLQTELLKLPDVMTLALLGLGEDGHCASFFPHSPQLNAALDIASGKPCQAIASDQLRQARMTLSLGRILASKLIIIYFTGEKKRQTYQQALTAGPVENLPIRSMLTQQQCPVAVYWAP